jgi:phage shock protein B
MLAAAEIVPLFAIFSIIVLPIIAGTLIVLAVVIKGSGRRRRSGLTEAEETQLIQEMNRSLTRLENRIEALETIILERDSRGKPVAS